jgi:hypothetical protein
MKYNGENLQGLSCINTIPIFKVRKSKNTIDGGLILPVPLSKFIPEKREIKIKGGENEKLV